MKYIKTFESNIKKIYKKGDLVFVTNHLDQFLLPYAKIISRFKHRPDKEPIDKYYVEILFPNTEHWSYYKDDDEHCTMIEDYLIIRKLSKKEIEELDLKTIANKYNL